MKLIDRTGQTYGRLTVISRAKNDKWGCARWLCLCECGKEKIVNVQELKNGDTRSCGCLNSDAKIGYKNPAWRGGKTKVGGYVQVKKPEHHRANNQGYVFEHILVMERILNRQIMKGEVVHHCDGNKSNNEILNLRLFPNNSEHVTYHHQMRSMGMR